MSKLTRTQKEKIRAALAMMEEAQEYRPILGAVGGAADATRLVRFALSAEDEGREHFGVALRLRFCIIHSSAHGEPREGE